MFVGGVGATGRLAATTTPFKGVIEKEMEGGGMPKGEHVSPPGLTLCGSDIGFGFFETLIFFSFFSSFVADCLSVFCNFVSVYFCFPLMDT